MKKSNFLVLGNYGNFNIGDELLLKSLILDYFSKYRHFNFFIPTRHPNFVDIYHEEFKDFIKPFNIFDFKKLFYYLFKSNQIIVGGGGIWSAYTGRLAKFLPFFIMFSGFFKPVILKGIGFYNTASIWEKILVNISLFFTKKVEVRDKESYNNIWNIVKKSVDVSIKEDLACNIPTLISYKKRYYDKIFSTKPYVKKIEAIRKRKIKIVGISVKPLIDKSLNDLLIREFVSFLKKVERRYPNSLYFCFFPFAYTCEIEDDKSLIDSILRKSGLTDFLVIPHDNPIYWFLFIQKYIDFFICMRFHSVVLSYITNKNFIAIPYENKILQFLDRQRDFNDFNIIHPKDINNELLLYYLNKFFKNK